ncbi:hypothetical protein Raf01_13260 [Rugosimonospora africana]|uniref:Uncharacterized protein n=1 Tax=Rugosimonospora africana TaxID=556532 RepID=A0A8J3QLI1_9ACTN|nr:hypothetical protein Raf01_13260 [Rugosimonospora africana]
MGGARAGRAAFARRNPGRPGSFGMGGALAGQGAKVGATSGPNRPWTGRLANRTVMRRVQERGV